MTTPEQKGTNCQQSLVEDVPGETLIAGLAAALPAGRVGSSSWRKPPSKETQVLAAGGQAPSGTEGLEPGGSLVQLSTGQEQALIGPGWLSPEVSKLSVLCCAVLSLPVVSNSAAPWTVAHQAPLSM